MDYTPFHAWDVTPNEAIRLQWQLRDRLQLQAPVDFAPRLVAGADVSMTRNVDLAYAGIVVIELATMTTVAEATAIAPLTFPYIPGLLSFRELPALAEAWCKLAVRPDVMLLDGHGIAHPRRMGIACHAGLLFNLPTVGCAKSLLTGRFDMPGPERGAQSPIISRGDTIGMALRTRANVSPVYVSPGHLMDLSTAVQLILQLTPEGRYRLPETTRRAHVLVNRIRMEAETA